MQIIKSAGAAHSCAGGVVKVSQEDGGFEMSTPAKTNIGYRSRDEVLVGTDFNADGTTLTDSGERERAVVHHVSVLLERAGSGSVTQQ